MSTNKPESSEFDIKICWENEKEIRKALNSIQSRGQAHKLEAEVVIQYCEMFSKDIAKSGVDIAYWIDTKFNISTNCPPPRHGFPTLRHSEEWYAFKVIYATVELRSDGWHLIHVSREKRRKFDHESEVHPMHFPDVVRDYYGARRSA